MSVTMILELNTKPGNANDLKNFLRDELHHTRGFDGCNGVTIHTNQDDPNNWVFVSNWDSKAQYDKYLGWRGERGDMEKLTGWVAGEPSIRCFENAGI